MSEALEVVFARLLRMAQCSRWSPAMIRVAREEAGSLVVLPTVSGFLFVLYLALAESPV